MRTERPRYMQYGTRSWPNYQREHSASSRGSSCSSHEVDPPSWPEYPSAGQWTSNSCVSVLSDRSLALHTPTSKWDAGNPASNLSSVTLLPVSEEVPLTAVTLELQNALIAIDRCTSVCSKSQLTATQTSHVWPGC